MDSLTQLVLGASVGEAVLGKKVGNKALFYGAVAGTIPDLDIISKFFTDTISAIELHRSFSHSIFFCVLMSPVFGWVVNRIERKQGLGWKPWAKLFFWGLVTHPLLDAFTTWGTRLFWPFDMRLAFNSIFVIDPLYTVPFLICTLMVLFCKKGSKTRRKLNSLGLLISSVYLLSTLVVKGIVDQKFENSLHEQGVVFSKISSRPSPMNIILWNVNVETEEAYLIGDYSFFDSSPITFKAYQKNRVASKPMEAYPNVQRLISIAEGWFILEMKENEWFFNDLRFGLIPQRKGPSFFAFSYQLKEENGLIIATEIQKTKRDAQYLLEVLWDRIQGK